MTRPIPADATEIVDADIPRADLVKSPAHGMPFFIAKSAPGDPDDPASPAWEELDAENANKAIATLTDLRGMIAGLLARESVEFIAGDDVADENAYDLDGALCALDCVLGVLAPYAVTEQAEADERAEATLIKAADDPAAALGALVELCKAGRVLSSKNEAAIRGAVAALSDVLNSLPMAPEADVVKETETDAAEDVAKEAEITAEAEAPAEAEVVAKDADAPADAVVKDADPDAPAADAVVKADDSDLSTMSDDDLKRQAITSDDTNARDAALKEIGLRALAGTPTAADDPAEEDAPADTTLDPAEVDPNAAGADMAKASDDADDPIVKALAAQRDEMNKDFDAKLAEWHAEVVKSVGDLPMPTRVLSNGAVPTAEMLRGQDETPGQSQTGMARAVELVKSIEDPDARQAAYHELVKSVIAPQ